MENASKALLIAGGMLIVILILSSLVYMFQGIRTMPETEEQLRAADELEKFNKQYQVYEKEGLRGTDVITIANKTISNNKKTTNGLTTDTVTVTLEMKKEVTGQLYHYVLDNGTKKMKLASGFPQDLNNIPSLSSRKLDKDVLYILTDKSVYESAVFRDIFNDTTGEAEKQYVYCWGPSKNYDPADEQDRNTNAWKWDDYYMRSNLASEFKRRKFDCVVEEDPTTGRVNTITITEH